MANIDDYCEKLLHTKAPLRQVAREAIEVFQERQRWHILNTMVNTFGSEPVLNTIDFKTVVQLPVVKSALKKHSNAMLHVPRSIVVATSEFLDKTDPEYNALPTTEKKTIIDRVITSLMGMS